MNRHGFVCDVAHSPDEADDAVTRKAYEVILRDSAVSWADAPRASALEFSWMRTERGWIWISRAQDRSRYPEVLRPREFAERLKAFLVGRQKNAVA